MPTNEHTHTHTDEAFIHDEFQTACEYYDKAMKLDDRNLTVMLHRSAAYLKLKKFVKSEFDAKRAIQLQRDNALAHFRAGVALFHQDRFKDANHMFTKTKQLGSTITSLDLWMRKCAAELKRAPAAEAVATPKTEEKKVGAASEKKTAEVTVKKEEKTTQAANAQTNASLSSASAITTTSSSTTLPSNAAEAATATAPSTQAVATPAAAPAAQPAPAPAPQPAVPAVPLAEKVRYEYYQHGMELVVTLFAKGVNAADVEVKLDDAGRTLAAKVKLSDGSVYERSWQLFGDVDPAQLRTRVTAYKIEITMQKRDAKAWSALERTQEEESKTTSSKLPTPYVQKKDIDWGEVEQTVAKAEEEEKPEGDAALQKLFQRIYKDSGKLMFKA